MSSATGTKKLTITVEEQVYEGLYKVVGKGKISRFLNELVKPLVLKEYLEKAYQQMSQDEAREVEAQAWTENLIGETL